MAAECKSLDESDTSKANSGLVKLNVGGTIYTATKSVLSKAPYFAGMLAGTIPATMDENGAYYVDRNGKCFKYVLDFLRSDYVRIPSELVPLFQVEANFFLIDIKSSVKQKTKQKKILSSLLIVTSVGELVEDGVYDYHSMRNVTDSSHLRVVDFWHR